MDRGEAQAERGEVLVQGERDRAVGDDVEELGREEQAVDDRACEGEVRQEREQTGSVPWEARAALRRTR